MTAPKSLQRIVQARRGEGWDRRPPESPGGRPRDDAAVHAPHRDPLIDAIVDALRDRGITDYQIHSYIALLGAQTFWNVHIGPMLDEIEAGIATYAR